MKPTTKLQKRVVELAFNGPLGSYRNKKEKWGYKNNLTKNQEKWAFKNLLSHNGVRLKSGKITCLDCAAHWQSEMLHGWHDVMIKQECPGCKTLIQIKTTRKKVFEDFEYFQIIDRAKEFQVIRFFKISGHYKSGLKASISIIECGQIWISPIGKYECVGRNNSGMGHYNRDHWSSEFCLRRRDYLSKYNCNVQIYHYKKIIPEIRRNGFNNNFHELRPFDLFFNIWHNPKFETLFKKKYYKVLKYIMGSSEPDFQLEKYWSHLKLAIKNKYLVKKPQVWFDHIDTLESMNRSSLNPKNIFPKDLEKEHQRVLEIQRNKLRKKQLKDLKDKIKEDNILFKKRYAKFFDFKIQDKTLTIEAFQSIEQLFEESNWLRHCAFRSKYHLKENSLMFSAKIGKQVIETIEFNLSRMEVVQSRGFNNTSTKHNKRIVKLLNDNAIEISKRLKPKRKQKKKVLEMG